MPLYEYQCRECGHRFERIRKFSDAPLTECPSCGGQVEKLFSAPAIQFKGAGWYITDYARKPESKDANAAKDGASARDGGKDGGAEGAGEKAGTRGGEDKSGKGDSAAGDSKPSGKADTSAAKPSSSTPKTSTTT